MPGKQRTHVRSCERIHSHPSVGHKEGSASMPKKEKDVIRRRTSRIGNIAYSRKSLRNKKKQELIKRHYPLEKMTSNSRYHRQSLCRVCMEEDKTKHKLMKCKGVSENRKTQIGPATLLTA